MATAQKKAEAAATWTPVGDLTPWEDNPRINDGEPVDAVAESIRRFGFAAPIIARKEDGMVIAGHTRLKAAHKLGIEKVPVRWMDLDPADARLLALADNKLGEKASWDDGILAEIIRSIDEDDLLLAGFDADDLVSLLDDEPIGPEDIEPEAPPENPDSKRGEVYELGPHRLICGDCRDADTVTALLDGRKINVAFTSPPYASQRKYDESSGFKPIPPDEYVGWFDAVQANVREHLAEDGSWFVNIKEHCDDGQRSLYVKDLTIAHVRRWGWRFVDEFCWAHHGFPGSFPNRFKNGHEPVFHFAPGAAMKFRPASVRHESESVLKYALDTHITLSASGYEDSGGGVRAPGMALPSNVLRVSMGGDGTHSAAFPVALPAFFVKAFSDASDAIFDPFLGSGTTLIAAAKEGRDCYGVEISEGYCDVIRKRWTAWAEEAGQDPGPGALR